MRKRVILIAALCLVCVALVVIFMPKGQSSLRAEMEKTVDGIENALGEEWERQGITEVYDLEYSNGEGNTIVHHVCVTTYPDADFAEVGGVNMDAIGAVIDPEAADSSRECQVSSLPAMLYTKGERAYLCWTIAPGVSFVLEYDPDAVSEADIFRMAGSVPANAAATGK